MTESNENPDQADGTQQELLPPVQPPSAGFLMQLFVIPMVIVTVIAGLVLLIKWISPSGADPEKLVLELSKASPSSWQKALDVASLLNDPNNDELRKSDPLAAQLEGMLRGELDEAKARPERIELRTYLCSALGQMQVDRGFDELVQAAGMQEDFAEIKVRIAAIIAISRRIDNDVITPESARTYPALVDTLIKSSNANSNDAKEEFFYSELRTAAAFCLGIIGGEDSLDQLALLMNDPNFTVRFNATTGLARNGDSRGANRLLEMLDWDAKIENQDGTGIDRQTRYEILRNGIVATAQLLRKNPSVPRTDELKAAVKTLKEDDQMLPSVGKLIDREFSDID